MTIKATPADRAAIKAALRRSARLLAPPADEDATRQLAKHRLGHDIDAAIRLAVLAGEDGVAVMLVDAEITLGQSLRASALKDGIARACAEQGLPLPSSATPQPATNPDHLARLQAEADAAQRGN